MWIVLFSISSSSAVIRPLQNGNKNIKDTLILWKIKWESMTTNLTEKINETKIPILSYHNHVTI